MNQNYYEILQVPFDASFEEIKKSFRKLAKLYHPDKKTGNALLFKKVSEAYYELSDVEKRKEYNRQLYITNKVEESQLDHMKNSYQEFLKSQDELMKDKDPKKMFSDFMNEMDHQNNFNKSDIFNTLDATTLLSKMNEKDLEYSLQNEEFLKSKSRTYEKHFSEKFDPHKFNAMFEKKYKKKDDQQLINHSGPLAFNECVENIGTAFDQDQIVDTEFYTRYEPEINDPDDDIEPDFTIDTSYDNHNFIDTSYNEDIARKLKEREQEDQRLHYLSMKDYNHDDLEYCFNKKIEKELENDKSLLKIMNSNTKSKFKY